MAEATDHPQGSGEAPSRAAAPSPGERLSAWPERVASSGGELGAMPPITSESYRPLSLLALAAFGMSVVYTLLVVVGGVIALINHTPWLMPTWTFLLPLAVLLLCWVARNRIRNAEGALSGLAFTIWGVRLTIVVGLSYLAYFGFAFFAVYLQAQEYTSKFFEELKQGHSERAFLLATGIPPNDLDEAEMREMLAVRFNTPAGPGGASGPFTQFRQSQFVRTIEMSAAETRIVPKGAIDWGYGKGGYRVVLKYQVFTPLAEFEMSVETFGRDRKAGESNKGRQWQIIMQRGETGVLPASIKLTARGSDFMEKAKAAQGFTQSWQEKIVRQQWDEVYLDTLEPAERERARKDRSLNGRKKLAEGALIRIDDSKLWTSKRDRAAILARLQQTFRPRSDDKPVFQIRPQSTLMPLTRSEDGRVAILFDAQLTYLDEETDTPKYIAEGYIVASAEEGEGANVPSAWRIEGIEISSARTPSTMPASPRQPGDLGRPRPRPPR
jgi:hypothetical protein